MGLAASQARLLTITARLADNELRSQTINNAKMRLATQSSQASEEYVSALNNAQLMFSNTDINGLSRSQALTFNTMREYSQYNNQYGLVNSAGLLLVSERDAAIFKNHSDDLEGFLAEYGLEWNTTFFDDLNGLEKYESFALSEKLESFYGATGSKIGDMFSGMSNEDLEALYLRATTEEASIERKEYDVKARALYSEVKDLRDNAFLEFRREFLGEAFDSTNEENIAKTVAEYYSKADSSGNPKYPNAALLVREFLTTGTLYDPNNTTFKAIEVDTELGIYLTPDHTEVLSGAGLGVDGDGNVIVPSSGNKFALTQVQPYITDVASDRLVYLLSSLGAISTNGQSGGLSTGFFKGWNTDKEGNIIEGSYTTRRETGRFEVETNEDGTTKIGPDGQPVYKIDPTTGKPIPIYEEIPVSGKQILLPGAIITLGKGKNGALENGVEFTGIDISNNTAALAIIEELKQLNPSDWDNESTQDYYMKRYAQALSGGANLGDYKRGYRWQDAPNGSGGALIEYAIYDDSRDNPKYNEMIAEIRAKGCNPQTYLTLYTAISEYFSIFDSADWFNALAYQSHKSDAVSFDSYKESLTDFSKYDTKPVNGTRKGGGDLEKLMVSNPKYLLDIEQLFEDGLITIRTQKVNANNEPMYEIAYQTDSKGNILYEPLRDESGHIVYQTETDEAGNILYGPARDANGNIIYEPEIDEETGDIKYQRDANGFTVYEVETDENGNVVYEINKDEDGNIIYQVETDESGNILYEPQRDENGNPLSAYNDNGDLVPLYLTDANGDKIPVYKKDENGNKIPSYKTDENDNKVPSYKRDESGNKIPVVIYKTDENGNKIPVTAPIYKLDSSGNKIQMNKLDESNEPIPMPETEYRLVNGAWTLAAKQVPVYDSVVIETKNLRTMGSEAFTSVVESYMLDYMLDVLGEPKYAWVDVGDSNGTQNPDAKAQWYENLFNRMRQGYKVLENGLASSKEWLEYALEAGVVTMEQVDKSYNWISLDYKTCSNIYENSDNSDTVAKAEAKYNRAMNDIKQKDSVYDLQLKNIDTEHQSLQTEYDSVKTVMNKNIERTMKFDQSA